MGEAFIIRRGGASGSDNGNLNLTVVGGTVQPTGSENMVWVNTNTEINGYAFSATEPTSPVEGMVWFKTVERSSAAMNIDKKNTVMLYPGGCSQYINGAWVEKDAQTYLNGAWVDWRTYFYNRGDECTDLTGGWLAMGMKTNSSGQGTAKAPVITKNADSLEITFATTQYATGMVYTKNRIDLTELESLSVDGEFVSTSGTQVTASLFSSIPTHAGQSVADVKLAKDVTGSVSAKIDVSAISGEYYIALEFYNNAVDGCTFKLFEYYGEV